MDFPLFQILSFPDELEKSLNPQSQKYVRDTKAMVSTAVDVKELPDAYVFVADMPGLKSADVKVQLENDNVLVIGGTRKREEADPKVKYIRMERNSGTFMRKFTLPQNSDLEKIGASCVDGVLTVVVPKVPPSATIEAENHRGYHGGPVGTCRQDSLDIAQASSCDHLVAEVKCCSVFVAIMEA